jgi:hypothetical protein
MIQFIDSSIQFISVAASSLAFKGRLNLYFCLPCCLFLSWWAAYSTLELALQIFFTMVLERIQHQLSLDRRVSRTIKILFLVTSYDFIRLSLNKFSFYQISSRIALASIICMALLFLVNRFYAERIMIFQD